MKKTITTILLSCFFVITAFAQEWNPNGDNSMKGNLTIYGANTSGNYRDISFNSGYKEQSIIRGYLHTQNTGLQFLTTKLSSNPEVRMVINSVGNVGIGTTAPTQTLDVAGTITGTVIRSKKMVSDSTLTIYGANTSGNYRDISFNSGYREQSIIRGYLHTENTGLQFLTAKWQSNPEVRMVISSVGNVGIGTTTPTQKLDVAGTITGTVIRSKKMVSDSTLTIYGANTSGNYRDISFNSGYKEQSIIRGYLHTENTGLQFLTAKWQSNPEVRMVISSVGNVGIGTENPTAKLDVAGTIKAHEVIVEVPKGADFVFEQGYSLKPLSEVESFVKKNKHLPEVQSEKEMQANGLSVNEFQIKLLQKIEELTLYIIEQDKRIADLENKKE